MLRKEQPRYRGSFPGRSKSFSLLHIFHARSGTHCVLFNGYRRSSHSHNGRFVTDHLHAVPRLTVSETRPALPSTPVYLSQNPARFISSTEYWWEVYSTGTLQHPQYGLIINSIPLTNCIKPWIYITLKCYLCIHAYLYRISQIKYNKIL
jgi:hypothetical protein